MRKPPLAEAQTALGKQQNAGICPLRKVMAKNHFKYSGRPPFWIFGIHFGRVTHRVPNVLLCTKFHQNRMTFRWRRFNDVQDGGRCRERRINKSRAQTPPRPKCQPKVIRDRIRSSGLILIRMSAGSLPKCCGEIADIFTCHRYDIDVSKKRYLKCRYVTIPI